MRRAVPIVMAAVLAPALAALAAEPTPQPRHPPAPRKVAPPRLSVPSLRLSPETRQALSDSDEGLVESPLPDGGVLVDLKGRYQSALVAVVDAAGNLHIGCLSHVPNEKASKELKQEQKR